MKVAGFSQLASIAPDATRSAEGGMQRAMTQARSGSIRQFLRDSRSFMLGAAIGSGMTARAAERAGADFLLALNAGRFRAMGGSSPASILPIRNSNDFVASFGRTEILPNTKLPVFIGANVFDPRLNIDRFLDKVSRWGFSGVTNFPSVIHVDEARRAILERFGLGYAREVELLVSAAKHGLMTVAYTHTRSEACRMVEAGVQAICMNFNLNPDADSGAQESIGLAELAARTRDIAQAVYAIDKNAVCLIGGGPITKSDELLDVCRETAIQGFIGGSSLDRVPLETSVLEVVSGFKMIHLLREKVDLLQRQLRLSGYQHGLIVQSSAMRRVLEMAQRLAVGPTPVLIWGEVGAGKRRVASLVHALSDRRHCKLVLFPCRTGPVSEIIGTLFGMERSEENRRRISLFEAACDTSILTLHLERLSADVQERLADYLETGTFMPLNGTALLRSTARVLATATVSRGADLGSVLCPRLLALFAGLDIALPALAGRLEDLPQLLQQFTVEAEGDAYVRALAIENSAFLALASYDWPGNLRELRQIVSQLVALPSDTRITAETLTPLLKTPCPKRASTLSERDWIIEALKRNRLKRGKTAHYLGLSRKTLYNKIKKFQILE